MPAKPLRNLILNFASFQPSAGRGRGVKGTLAAIWDVPKPVSVLKVQVEDGTSIFLRRHGNPEGPRLILSHGNGLAIDLYYPFWSLLSREFDVLVHDLRNHGWNETGNLERHSVGAFACDHDQVASAVAGRFGEKPTSEFSTPFRPSQASIRLLRRKLLRFGSI